VIWDFSNNLWNLLILVEEPNNKIPEENAPKKKIYLKPASMENS
jgi:hypothetical protein